MIENIIGFLYQHFFELIATWLVALFTKKMVADLGKDRAEIIQNAVATAMYWAEQNFGIATGELKWEKAWRKIRELLDTQNIKLTKQEEKDVEVIMESYVPEINATTYQSLPAEEIEKRSVYARPKQYLEALEWLKEKYNIKTEGASNEPDPS
ncbi:MAG: phage holin, LLH family [Atribacterota bacterium]|nr:phage holin, LLH family [Atribacterota bacterium]